MFNIATYIPKFSTSSGKISIYLSIHFLQLLIIIAWSAVLHLRLYVANSYRRIARKLQARLHDALTWTDSG